MAKKYRRLSGPGDRMSVSEAKSGQCSALPKEFKGLREFAQFAIKTRRGTSTMFAFDGMPRSCIIVWLGYDQYDHTYTLGAVRRDLSHREVCRIAARFIREDVG